MKKIIFISVIISQFILVMYLGTVIVKKRNQVLGQQILNPIKKENIQTNEKSKLSYFYEFKPNSITPEGPWITFFKGEYRMNADTLREDKEYAIKKSDNTFRIIALGDSFTYGLYVDVEDSWPKQLEQLLNNSTCSTKFEVINLGLFGYDVDYEMERYLLRGTKYNPDLVIWFLKDDDLREETEKIRAYYFDFEQNMTQEERDSYKEKGVLAPAWKKAYDTYFNEYKKLDEKDFFDKRKQTMSSFITKQETAFMLAYLPEKNDLFESVLNQLSKEHQNVLISEVFDIYEPKYIDKYTFNLSYDAHPTAVGHKAIAESMYTYLSENNIITCN